MSPARTLFERLIGYRLPGGLGSIGGVVTPGYASCCGPPAAFLALARRGLLPVVRLRRTFPALSMVGMVCRGFIVSHLGSAFPAYVRCLPFEWSGDCLSGLGFVVSRHRPRGMRACRRQASGSDPMQTECGAKRRTKCSVGLRAPSNNESPPDGGRMNNTVNK